MFVTVVTPRLHAFSALAFAENFSLRELSAAYPAARRTAKQLRYAVEPVGEVFIYPFGAAVFRDLSTERREAELARLRSARPGLTTQVIREEFTVREVDGTGWGIAEGVLTVDRLTPDRSGIVALTVAQSAAMEYYERLVDQMFLRTAGLVEKLERQGTVSIKTRPLHRFIGEAIGTRSEVFMVLSLLDKPDETWYDPAMDRIYMDLRSEFDLADRYTALELKLRSVQEALELVLDVARERRLVLLEVSIVILIVLELILPILRLR
jgi:uncharacterized Rmd1/YagE family protein